jgi:hypothetical protein
VGFEDEMGVAAEVTADRGVDPFRAGAGVEEDVDLHLVGDGRGDEAPED